MAFIVVQHFELYFQELFWIFNEHVDCWIGFFYSSSMWDFCPCHYFFLRVFDTCANAGQSVWPRPDQWTDHPSSSQADWSLHNVSQSLWTALRLLLSGCQSMDSWPLVGLVWKKKNRVLLAPFVHTSPESSGGARTPLCDRPGGWTHSLNYPCDPNCYYSSDVTHPTPFTGQ